MTWHRFSVVPDWARAVAILSKNSIRENSAAGLDEIITVPEREMSQQKRRQAAVTPKTLRVGRG